MIEWEYKTCQVDLEKIKNDLNQLTGTTWALGVLGEKELADLGSEGWELVNAVHRTKLVFNSPAPHVEYVAAVHYIFKRPKR